MHFVEYRRIEYGGRTVKLSDRSGNVAIMFALMLPVLLLAAGGAIDYGSYGVQRAQLQEIADTAALGSAREFNLAQKTAPQIENTALRITKSSLQASKLQFDPTPDINAKAVMAERLVTVTLLVHRGSFIPQFSAAPKILKVTSTAVATSGAKVCLLALAESGRAITLDKGAKITAKNCGAYSNSADRNSIRVVQDSLLTSAFACSAGGYDGPDINFVPAPLTDCPGTHDPLADRPQPSFAGCDHTKLVLDSGAKTLQPGVYCGGLTITGDAVVTLEAGATGVYVIKNGELRVSGQASLISKNAGFFLTGKKATFRFDKDTTIDLSAPLEGELAGLLFFEDRKNKTGRKSEIWSNDARNLLGTIYLPRSTLFIGAKNPVGDLSAYTIIVADSLELLAGPELVLNTNYDETTVPVPVGVGPVDAGFVHLRE